jgi:hypothetical protein
MIPTENARRSEVINYLSFFEQLQKLSDSKNPIPLRPENINSRQVNEELRQKRICVDIINSSPELQKSIRKKQFRDETQGRGPAIVAVIGENGYKVFSTWAQTDSKNQSRLKSKNKDKKKETSDEKGKMEKTKCRGEMQLMADILTLASGNMTKEVFCLRTNWRVAMSHKDNPELLKRFEISTDSIEQKKLKHLSSIPVGSPVRVYQKILSLTPKLDKPIRPTQHTRVDLSEMDDLDNAIIEDICD